MSPWIGLIVDFILIGVVGVGIAQAMRLIRQLRDLRAGRAEMERFIREFNTAIIRAEAGIKSLRAAARESGDDLENLVEKAVMVRDELNFIVESADNVAERLTNSATTALNGEPKTAAKPVPEDRRPTPSVVTEKQPAKPEAAPASRAEKELLQALQKLS